MAFKLLGISGALRRASTNTALVRACGELAGDNVDFKLADIDMPLYNGDVEDAGYPETVTAFVEDLRWADAIVISTPEYNKNLSGALKNALDWQSRFKPGPMAGKPVAILSATAGAAGGQLAQFSLRHCLTPFGCHVLAQPQVHVGDNYHEDVFKDGRLVREKTRGYVKELMEALRAAV